MSIQYLNKMKPHIKPSMGRSRLVANGAPTGVTVAFNTAVQTDLTYAENDLRLSHTANTYRCVPTIQYIPIAATGKGYCEITINGEASTDLFCFGFLTSDYSTLASYLTAAGIGATYGFGAKGGNANVTWQANGGGATTLYDGGLITAGDVCALAIDCTADKIFFGNDGGGASIVWYEAPNGTTHVPPSDAGIVDATTAAARASDLYLACSLYGNGEDVTWNFGQSSFAHTLPTGYAAMNTIMVSP